MQSVLTNSDLQTLQAGENFAKRLKNGDVIALNGDLGAGKTVFVKGIAKGLGIIELIVSPTFTIVREYIGEKPLYHFDAYRINDSEEMFDVGFYEYIYGRGVAVIEWASKIADILPKNRIEVTINKTGDTARNIFIKDIKEE